ncbi:MAG: hypothetical protein Q8Q49_02700 [bacterium]|nr:hypothetical protein [bacterium]
MAVETQNYLYFDDAKPESGIQTSVSHRTGELELKELVPGFGLVDTRGAVFGTCTSETSYYKNRFPGDLKQIEKIRANFARLYGPVVKETDSAIALMSHSGLHEGSGIITKAKPDTNRDPIDVLAYPPVIENGQIVGLKRQIIPMNFQDGFKEGRQVVFTPAFVCDTHSNANNIDPKTGWPVQCDRKTDNGHEPKATRGHTEAIGTAVQGIVPARLDSLIPVPNELQRFIEADPKRRALLASVEPMGCVFQAHGPLLRDEKIPQSILVIGDGPNALLNLMFYKAFAPNARIVVSGKNQQKLDAMRRINPEKIVTVASDGRSYDEVERALKETTGSTQAEVVLPTVALSEDVVGPFIKNNGLLIWWAASISEHANGSTPAEKRYNELHSYGGAPRAEFSAMALMDSFAKTDPDIFTPLLETPAIHYLPMGEQAAVEVEKWLNANGKWIGPDGLSKKLIVTM